MTEHLPNLPDHYRKVVAQALTKDFRQAAEIVTAPMPEPAANEVIVKVKVAGVNASDVNMTAGAYFSDIQPPFDLGMEAAGEIVAKGDHVSELALGQPVLITNFLSGYSEYIKVNAKRVVPVAEASAERLSLILSGLTASIGLREVGQMATNETVLVTAAAGGAGQFAVQLAKLAGNHVIGTCGSESKKQLLTKLGCDRVINYKQENLAEILQAEYPKGIDLVFEAVGRDTFDACIENLAIRGRLVLVGYISEYKGTPETITAPRIYTQLLWKSASIRAFLLNHYGRCFPNHVQDLLQWYEQGKLTPQVDPKVFNGVESVVDAVEYLQSGENCGKVVVRF